MLKPRRSGNCPGPGQRLRIAIERCETFGVVGKLHGEFFPVRNGRNEPGFGRIADIAIGQQHDRRHIFRGKAAGLYRDIETVGGAVRRENDQRGIAIAAIDRLIEVGLFGFCRHTR